MPQYYDLVPLDKCPDGGDKEQHELALRKGPITVPDATYEEIMARPPCLYKVKPKPADLVVQHQIADPQTMTKRELLVFATTLGLTIQKKSITKDELLELVERKMSEKMEDAEEEVRAGG